MHNRVAHCNPIRTDFARLSLPQGAGERGPADGSELDRACVHGPLKVAQKGPYGPGLPDLSGFLIVNPQCPPPPKSHADILPALKAIVDECIAAHPVDTARIYLTGLSMGGMGSWALANAYPHLFAAMAPICGGARFHLPPLDPSLTLAQRRAAMRGQAAVSAADMARLASVPCYIFHGQRDPVVPVSGSTDAYAALVAAGNTRVKMAIYPQTDLKTDAQGNAIGAHDSWTQTYEWAGLCVFHMSTLRHSYCVSVCLSCGLSFSFSFSFSVSLLLSLYLSYPSGVSLMCLWCAYALPRAGTSGFSSTGAEALRPSYSLTACRWYSNGEVSIVTNVPHPFVAAWCSL